MNVHLRKLEEKDAPFMLEWMHDPSINRFFRFDAEAMTLEKCKEYIIKSNNSVNDVHFAIVDDNDEYLGTISLKNIKSTDAEYAISTRAKAHGTGAALSATKQILDYAFDELNLEKVYLNVLVENERANAFYKKAGFVFSHTEEKVLEIRGIKRNLNWYYMKKEQYYTADANNE